LKDSSINELIFETKHVGELKIKKYDNQSHLELDFPMGDPQPIEFDNQILDEIKFKLNLLSTQEILSIRGGYVNCEFDQNNKRVLLRGSALIVIQGQFLLQQTQLNLLKPNQNFE